jgi:excisionase family DNA binding protein
MIDNDRWLSLNEICEYLGVGRDTVLNWIKTKGMPSCKMGKFWKFKKEDVDEWVRSGDAAIEQSANEDERNE